MQWHDRIGRRLKLKDLHTLQTVAQLGTMARAASHLSVTQPAVSKAIADMERMLQVRLLDRRPQGIELTPYGRSLLKWGTVVFDDLRQAMREIEFLTDPGSGEVGIGATGSMIEGFLPGIVGPLAADYPRIKISISLGGSVEGLYRELRERQIDLILGRIQKTEPERDLQSEVLFDEPLFVVAGIRNPWIRRRKIELSDLIGEPWTLPPHGSFAGSLVTDAFMRSGLPVPSRGIFTSSIRMHIALLGSGRMLAMLPGSVLSLASNRSDIRVLPVKLPVHPPPVGIVRLQNRTLSPVAQIFLDRARAVAKQLPKHTETTAGRNSMT